jgi:drug/metabolite transporter (DMT)-like permease
VLGAGIYAPMATCFFLCVQRLPASLAEMTLYTYPLLVTVFNVVILQERFTWRRGLALVLGLVGCYLLLDVRAIGWDLAGVLWGLAAAFLYALYYTLSQKLEARVEPRASTLYTVTFIAVFFVVLRPPWAALTHLNHPLEGWFSVVGLALVASVLSLQFFFLAVARIGSWRTAIFGVGEPLGAVILAVLLLGERLSPGQLAGGAILLGAVLLVSLA